MTEHTHEGAHEREHRHGDTVNSRAHEGHDHEHTEHEHRHGDEVHRTPTSMRPA